MKRNECFMFSPNENKIGAFLVKADDGTGFHDLEDFLLSVHDGEDFEKTLEKDEGLVPGLSLGDEGVPSAALGEPGLLSELLLEGGVHRFQKGNLLNRQKDVELLVAGWLWPLLRGPWGARELSEDGNDRLSATFLEASLRCG